MKLLNKGDNMQDHYIWGPTFSEMLHPDTMPNAQRTKALQIKDTEPLSPLNLFNITWKDGNNAIRHIILPPELTGVASPICVILGSGFPTGSHKVGATYSCTIERQVDSSITPSKHRLVWPSTGNYGVGGAYIGQRMNYESLVLLPEMMSKERFDKITYYGAHYIKTPGCESNVKEIYDKANMLSKEENTIVVNQFAEFGNYRFHYHVTGNTLLELFDNLQKKKVGKRFAAITSAMGSAGTIACGDRVKQVHHNCKIIGLEPIQCPTLYCNGFGGHDIQGIGDKHVTWIHNTDNMDAIMCIDEWDCKKGMQLIHDTVGHEVLIEHGISEELISQMKNSFGISGICNILGAIKTAKHYQLNKDDILFTIATDSIDRYYSVLGDMIATHGCLNKEESYHRLFNIFHNQPIDYISEATQHTKNSWANLKYYTWVEQQGKSVSELNAQRHSDYWLTEQEKISEIDQKINERRTL